MKCNPWVGGSIGRRGFPMLGTGKRGLSTYIKELFKNGEQGFAYDPNNLSTMFQDASVTVPVTGAGQPVGLILDNSKGLVLGAEVLTNGNFASGKASWANMGNWWSIVGGRAYHPASNSYKELSQSFSAINKLCMVQFDYQVLTASGTVQVFYVNYAGAVKTILLPSGSGVLKFAVHGGIQKIGFSRSSVLSAEFYIDNVSVKAFSGNPAYQTTSSMRPLLTASPQRLDFDIVDDKLITKLPAQLTGCTVVRAVPNVGTQILTNQTIPTTYNYNTDHCGLIVINRALTATETSQITKLFNKAAGVRNV